MLEQCHDGPEIDDSGQPNSPEAERRVGKPDCGKDFQAANDQSQALRIFPAVIGLAQKARTGKVNQADCAEEDGQRQRKGGIGRDAVHGMLQWTVAKRAAICFCDVRGNLPIACCRFREKNVPAFS